MDTDQNISPHQTIDLLNRCWMTHDGMWFFHCLQELGIDTTNRLNKAAIKSLSAIEIERIKKAVGFTGNINSFEAFKDFFTRAARIVIPDFMGVDFSFPGPNQMAWQFAEKNCFAYKGVKRLGVIDQYECGVLYRISCWLDVLGIAHSFSPGIGNCLMHTRGQCNGKIELFC